MSIDAITKSKPRVGFVDISSGRVYFRGMNGAEHHRLIVHNAESPKTPMSEAEIAAMVVSDENGNRLFPNPEAGIPALMEMDSADLRALAVGILRHSKVIVTQAEADALEKKS